MNTHKAAYWLALAVFGLGLNSEYRQGAFPALHDAADRLSSKLCSRVARAKLALAQDLVAGLSASRAASRAEDQLVVADARALAEEQSDLGREAQDQARMVRDQIREQVSMIRSQLAIQRAQSRQMQRYVGSRVRVTEGANGRTILICPKTGAAVEIHTPDLSGLDTDVAEIEEEQ